MNTPQVATHTHILVYIRAYIVATNAHAHYYMQRCNWITVNLPVQDLLEDPTLYTTHKYTSASDYMHFCLMHQARVWHRLRIDVYLWAA